MVSRRFNVDETSAWYFCWHEFLLCTTLLFFPKNKILRISDSKFVNAPLVLVTFAELSMIDRVCNWDLLSIQVLNTGVRILKCFVGIFLNDLLLLETSSASRLLKAWWKDYSGTPLWQKYPLSTRFRCCHVSHLWLLTCLLFSPLPKLCCYELLSCTMRRGLWPRCHLCELLPDSWTNRAVGYCKRYRTWHWSPTMTVWRVESKFFFFWCNSRLRRLRIYNRMLIYRAGALTITVEFMERLGTLCQWP
jgi:hypothetical protein